MQLKDIIKLEITLEKKLFMNLLFDLDIILKKELLLNNLIIKFDMEDILKKLIEYPTISESSNINLMNYIDNYLKKFDIKGKLIQGEKINLIIIV